MGRNQSFFFSYSRKCGSFQWKIYNEKGSQTRAGAWVVLIFGPNLKLAVLIELVLIKKKRVFWDSKCQFLKNHEAHELLAPELLSDFYQKSDEFIVFRGESKFKINTLSDKGVRGESDRLTKLFSFSFSQTNWQARPRHESGVTNMPILKQLPLKEDSSFFKAGQWTKIMSIDTKKLARFSKLI